MREENEVRMKGGSEGVREVGRREARREGGVDFCMD